MGGRQDWANLENWHERYTADLGAVNHSEPWIAACLLIPA
jgi:hypothetical protein